MHHDHTSDPAERGGAVLSPAGHHESGRRGKLIFLTLTSVRESFSVSGSSLKSLHGRPVMLSLESPVHKIGPWLASGT